MIRKEQHKASNIRWYAANAEKARKQSARWRAANVEKVAARRKTLEALAKRAIAQAKYRLIHAEELKARRRAKYKENPAKYKALPERRAISNAKWYSTHAEKAKAASIEYHKKHTEYLADRPRSKACEVCGRIGRVCFDHCHKSGKFRGWLCVRCNTTLGNVDDSPIILQKLAKYLKQHTPRKKTPRRSARGYAEDTKMIAIAPGANPVFQVVPAWATQPSAHGATTTLYGAEVISSDSKNVPVELAKADSTGLTIILHPPAKAMLFLAEVLITWSYVHADGHKDTVSGVLTRTGIDEKLQGGVFKQIQ